MQVEMGPRKAVCSSEARDRPRATTQRKVPEISTGEETAFRLVVD